MFTDVVDSRSRNQFERYGLYTAFKGLIPRSALQTKIDLDTFVNQRIQQRLKQGDDKGRADIFSFLEKSELPPDAVQQDSVIIVNGLTKVRVYSITAWSETHGSDRTGVFLAGASAGSSGRRT